jgi:hypothetical protein
MISLRLLSTACLAFSLAASGARADDAAEAPVALNFKELAKVTHQDGSAPVVPEELKKLDGKKVRVTGFIAPYDNPENMTKFMLTEAAVGCFFCNPPEENGVVFVRLAPKAKPLNFESDTVTVEGTLHFMGHNKKDEEAEGFLFTIDEAKSVAKK